MKVLRIKEDGKAEFTVDEENYYEITEIKRDHIYNIIELIILNEEDVVEMDDYQEKEIQNEAQKIIYTELYNKFIEVKTEKDRILTTINKEIEPVLEKYDIELSSEDES